MTDTHLEIERTYLLSGMPSLPPHAVAWRIEQGYVVGDRRRAAESDAPRSEGRLRRTTRPDGSVTCHFTVKQGSGLVRRETEREITEAEFTDRWPQTLRARLTKTRHRVTEGGLCWEIDAFDGVELVLAEVELPAADVVPPIPPWLDGLIVRDVTDDPAYRNFEIAFRLGPV